MVYAALAALIVGLILIWPRDVGQAKGLKLKKLAGIALLAFFSWEFFVASERRAAEYKQCTQLASRIVERHTPFPNEPEGEVANPEWAQWMDAVTKYADGLGPDPGEAPEGSPFVISDKAWSKYEKGMARYFSELDRLRDECRKLGVEDFDWKRG